MTNQTKSLYDSDYNLWLLKTAQLLRERQFNQIDYENLIEEIEAKEFVLDAENHFVDEDD